MKNVRCEYDRWVVETQLCQLRDKSDTLIGRACAMFQLQYGVCELHISHAPPVIAFIRHCHPHARKSASQAVLLVGCSSPFMRLTEHLAAHFLRAWCQ